MMIPGPKAHTRGMLLPWNSCGHSNTLTIPMPSDDT